MGSFRRLRRPSEHHAARRRVGVDPADDRLNHPTAAAARTSPIPETLPHAPLWRGLLAPPRCSDQNEHGTNDSSEDQDGESDCTQIPKLPTVDSIRSPQGYESMSQRFSIGGLTVLFHQERYSGVLSQKYP
jgi:hypothetical protein